MKLLSLILFMFLAMGDMGSNRNSVAKIEDKKPKPEESSRPHHVKLWNKMDIKTSWRGRIDATSKRILANKRRYLKAEEANGVPWQVIAGLHNMESTGSFRKHLHEGSSLSARTRWVPKGRPKVGKPPFSWEESAYDVLTRMKNMKQYNWSDIGETLYQCEKYNGLGYLKYHRDVNSPYLWSGTTNYKSGKYVSDGKWSQTAVSSQVGVAPILLKLNYLNLNN